MSRSLKPCVALAACASIATTVAGFALAGGNTMGGTTVDVGKSPLGHILVDSKGITPLRLPARQGHQ